MGSGPGRCWLSKSVRRDVPVKACGQRVANWFEALLQRGGQGKVVVTLAPVHLVHPDVLDALQAGGRVSCFKMGHQLAPEPGVPLEKDIPRTPHQRCPHHLEPPGTDPKHGAVSIGRPSKRIEMTQVLGSAWPWEADRSPQDLASGQRGLRQRRPAHEPHPRTAPQVPYHTRRQAPPAAPPVATILRTTSTESSLSQPTRPVSYMKQCFYEK